MKQGTQEKLKFKCLQRRLRLSLYQTVGLLESLWQSTYSNAPAGDIGRLTNEEICASIEWEGDPGQLIEALVEYRWLDRDDVFGLIVHNWSKHCASFLKGNFAKHGKAFADVAAKQRAKQPAKQVANGLLSNVPSTVLPSQANSSQANSSPAKPLAAAPAGSVQIPTELQSAEFLAAWDEWRAYRRERKLKTTDRTANAQLKMLARAGPAAAVEMIRKSITNGWTGLFALEQRNGKHNSSASRPGMQYDPNAVPDI